MKKRFIAMLVAMVVVVLGVFATPQVASALTAIPWATQTSYDAGASIHSTVYRSSYRSYFADWVLTDRNMYDGKSPRATVYAYHVTPSGSHQLVKAQTFYGSGWRTIHRGFAHDDRGISYLTVKIMNGTGSVLTRTLWLWT